MKLQFIAFLFQAYFFVCIVGKTIWYREVEIAAGEKWVKNPITIPEGNTGVIHAMVDTSSYVCGICGNELVQTNIYEWKTKLYTSKPISDENTIDSRNENLGKFSDLDAGNYALDIICKNSNRDCDVDIKIVVTIIPIPKDDDTTKDDDTSSNEYLLLILAGLSILLLVVFCSPIKKEEEEIVPRDEIVIAEEVGKGKGVPIIADIP